MGKQGRGRRGEQEPSAVAERFSGVSVGNGMSVQLS